MCAYCGNPIPIFPAKLFVDNLPVCSQSCMTALLAAETYDEAELCECEVVDTIFGPMVVGGEGE